MSVMHSLTQDVMAQFCLDVELLCGPSAHTLAVLDMKLA